MRWSPRGHFLSGSCAQRSFCQRSRSRMFPTPARAHRGRVGREGEASHASVVERAGHGCSVRSWRGRRDRAAAAGRGVRGTHPRPASFLCVLMASLRICRITAVALYACLHLVLAKFFFSCYAHGAV
uniref:Uncharacterized protein n=1 Tax=Ixodes ricinus TaxID=34613 RepID=A0A0K8RBA4_IXORI